MEHETLVRRETRAHAWPMLRLVSALLLCGGCDDGKDQAYADAAPLPRRDAGSSASSGDAQAADADVALDGARRDDAAARADAGLGADAARGDQATADAGLAGDGGQPGAFSSTE